MRRHRFATEFLRRPAALVALPLLLVALYFGAGAFVLRFDLDAVLFPRTPEPKADLGGVEALRVRGPSGAALLLRRFGDDRDGCVVAFPGRHGELVAAAQRFYPQLVAGGLAVYAVSWPGQEGAPGRALATEVQAMAAQAVAGVMRQCGAERTVVFGRSLGAMVAAYAAGTNRPAGLVLVSAAASLSGGLRAALRDHWALRPLGLLPVGLLVPHDWTLAEALPSDLHVAIFQGSADDSTPLAELRAADEADPAHPAIVEVPGGTHEDTLARTAPAIVATLQDMIRGKQQEVRAGGHD